MTNIIVLFIIYYARMNAIETNYKLLCAGIKYRQDEHVIQLHIFIPWHALKEESTPRRIGQSDWMDIRPLFKIAHRVDSRSPSSVSFLPPLGALDEKTANRILGFVSRVERNDGEREDISVFHLA